MNRLFLGIHVGPHDANVSLYDGKNFFYHKYERQRQIKRLGFPDLENYREIIISFLKFKKLEKKNIEAIAIGDAGVHLTTKNNKYDILKGLDDLSDSVYFVDHHYAHHLSEYSTKQSWTLDGHGNELKYSTIIKDDKIIETLKDPEDGKSLGEALAEVAFAETRSRHDAGHIMAFDALGKVQEKFFNEFKDYELNQSNIFYSIHKFNSFHSGKNGHVYNYIKTIHEISKVNHLKYLKKFFNKEDKFLFTGGVSQSLILNNHFKAYFPNIVITPHGYDGGISLGLIKFLTDLKGWELSKISNFPFIQLDEHPGFPTIQTIRKAAEYLAKGKIVLWFQGNGEIGPRALGNRSILANPMTKNMKQQINEKVKRRAWYRPYGASVLVEDYKKHFQLDWESPYMLYQAQVKDKDKFMAITHFDDTCRIQTVDSSHIIFYSLLQEFKKLTGFSVLLNTSLNLPGYPIAGSKKDSKNVFDLSQADMLVMGDEVFTK